MAGWVQVVGVIDGLGLWVLGGLLLVVAVREGAADRALHGTSRVVRHLARWALEVVVMVALPLGLLWVAGPTVVYPATAVAFVAYGAWRWRAATAYTRAVQAALAEAAGRRDAGVLPLRRERIEP